VACAGALPPDGVDVAVAPGSPTTAAYDDHHDDVAANADDLDDHNNHHVAADHHDDEFHDDDVAADDHDLDHDDHVIDHLHHDVDHEHDHNGAAIAVHHEFDDEQHDAHFRTRLARLTVRRAGRHGRSVSKCSGFSP
jgi:hypothetical protein